MLAGLLTALGTGILFGCCRRDGRRSSTRCRRSASDDPPGRLLQLALRAITAHRLRSFLTLLGIAVGIAAVILLTSIGEGIHRFVLAEFTQFGTNVIAIAPARPRPPAPTHPGSRPRCDR